MSAPLTLFSASLSRNAALLMLLLLPLVGRGQNAFTSSGLTYTQSFDDMNATGTAYVTNWTGIRYAGSGTINATLTPLTVLASGSTTGNAYNAGAFTGTATVTGDRALGSLASGTTAPAFGTSFVNNTGSLITQLDLAGFMEQWRTGNNVVIERLVFEYSLNATNLNSAMAPNASVATWIPIPAFDLVEKINGTTAGSLDGNAAANRTALTASITNLTIPDGAIFFIRWRDVDDSGSDGVYSIDNFSITATTGTPPVAVAPTVTTAPVIDVTATTATAGGNVTADGGATVSNRGVKYSTTSGFNPAASGTTVAGTPGGTGTFNASLTGLTASTTYYVVAFATNGAGSDGTGYGAEQSFTTSAPPPNITVMGTLADFNTFAGAVSIPSQSLSVSGTNLTAGIVITPPVGYELSTDDANFQTSPLTLGGAGTVAATTVYIRLTGATASLGTNLQIRSSGATNRDRTVSGTVVVEPTASPTVVASTPGTTTVTLTVSGGNGTRYLVVVRPSAAPNEVPTDGAPYTASAVYGAGSVTFNGSNNFIVSAGTATSVNVTGLTPSSSYVVSAYAYNVGTVAGFENYLVPTTGTTTFTTPAAPAAPLLAFDFSTNTPVTKPTAAANVSGANFSAGSGVSNITTTGEYRAQGWTQASTLDATDYFQFDFTPNANYQAALQSIVLDERRSGTGIRIWEIRSSLDNYATTVGSAVTVPDDDFVRTNQTVSLNSAAFGAITGTVTFRIYGYASEAGGGTWYVDNVQLFGTVTAAPAAPEVDVTQGGTAIPSGTGNYTFGPTGVGTSRDVTFTVTNTGTLDLTLSPPTLTGTDAGQYSIVPPPALTTLTPSSSTTFVVRFEPTSTGTKAAGISFGNNDSDENPYTFVLAGNGVAPTFTASPTALTINAVVSQTATQSYVLSGSNLPANAPVSISSDNPAVEVSTDGVNYAATASTNTTFTGTLSQSVQVRFTAGVTVGTTTATLTNTTGALSAPVTVTANATTPAAPAPIGLLQLEEDFNYAPGALVGQGGWVMTSGANAPIQVVAGTSTPAELQPQYPQGAPLNNNRARLQTGINSAQDVNKPFALPAGTTTYYVSAVVNLASATAALTDTYFLHLLENSMTFRGKIFARAEGSGFKFGLTNNSNAAAANFTAATYAFNKPYLLVMKCVVNPGTADDQFSLYVFDGAAPLTEPATPAIAPTTDFETDFALKAVGLRQNDAGPEVLVDGLRIATGWGTVIGRPTYTNPAAVIKAGNYFDFSLTNGDVLTPEGAVNVESNLILVNGLVNTSATNSLTLYQPATVTGGSDNSFVNGPVQRAIDGVSVLTSYVFPVGKAVSYRPLTLNINSQTTASTYTAEQQEGNPGQAVFAGNGLGSAPVKRVSVFRSFALSSTAVSNAVGSVTLSFGPNDGVNEPNDPGLVIAARNSAAPLWTNVDRSAFTGTGSGPGGPYVVGTLTSALFTNQVASATFVLGATNDNIGFGGAVNPLPVELTRFSAKRQADNNGVAVTWATASEENSAHFEVQRSLDGRTFATVATVVAQGNSTHLSTYAIVDKAAPAVALYYRLRQVDRDGTVAYSPAVSVSGSGLTAKVLLYPNPAQARISFQADVPTAYRVLNQLGQPLLRGTTEAGTATVPVSTLPAGLYLLELQTPTGRVVQKFEKE